MNSHSLKYKKLLTLAFVVCLAIVSFLAYQYTAHAASGCDFSGVYNSTDVSNRSCSMSPSGGNIFTSVSGHLSASGIDGNGYAVTTVCITGVSGQTVCDSREIRARSGEESLYAKCPETNCSSSVLSVTAFRADFSASAGSTEVPPEGCPHGGTPPNCNDPFNPNAGFCTPESQNGNVSEVLHYSMPKGAEIYSWRADDGDPRGDNDPFYDVAFHKSGTYNITANYNGYYSTCVAKVGGGGGGEQVGPPSSNLKLQICPKGTKAPCTQGVSVLVNQVQEFVAWYSEDGGKNWVDKTADTGFGLKENANAKLPDHNYNNSCSVGFCKTVRGLRYVPVDSDYGPFTKATYIGVVRNDQDCSTSGNGCPGINANYSGTGAEIYYRIVPIPPETIIAPTVLNIDNSTCSKLRINWADNSSNEQGFTVWRSTSPNSGFVNISGNLPPNSIYYVDTPPATGITFYYMVKAFKSGLPDAQSNTLGSVNNPCNNASISGKVFNDLNSNGSKGGNESGVNGRTVFLQNSAGTQTFATFTTYGDGDYNFANLTNGGSYRVTHPVPSGWTRTTDDSRPFTASGVETWSFGIHQDEIQFNYSLSNSGTSSATKGSGNVFTQNTITKSLSAGSAQPVTLSVSGAPSGVSYSIANNPCSPNCTSAITFTITPSAPTGTFGILVTGQPLGRTTQFNLVISSAPGNVSCSASPSSVFIGQAVTWTGAVSGGVPPYTYAWSGTNIPTSPAPSNNPYSKTYDTIGTKTAQLRVTDSLGTQFTCPSATAVVNFNPDFEEF